MKKRLLSVFLTLCMLLSMAPAAFAAEQTAMTNDIDGETLYTGFSKEFTITTTVGDDAAGKTVLGKSEFADSDAILSMEYFDEATQTWKNLLHDGDGNFGPADGIQIPAQAVGASIENKFRVTFKDAGNYLFTASLVEKDSDSVIASTTASFTVEPAYEFSINGVEDYMIAGQWDDDASATLKGNSGAPECSNVRILVQVTGPKESNPQIMAKDSLGNEYDLADIGSWGPQDGFPVNSTTNNETKLQLCFDMPGTYTATFQLVDVNNNNSLITEGSKTVTVVESGLSGELVSVSVVDGTDGYTPVTVPQPGQKLTANITVKNFGGEEQVIGSYPLNENAHYTWYYEGSDTVLGTEPVYTATEDNLGRILCVDVSVDGYTGTKIWTSENIVAKGEVLSVSVVDGTDGYTPVTVPRPGQKLTANITVKYFGGEEQVIGSYPLNENAHYKWYYEGSDTVLGTEPVYTATEDNLGKTLCVDVSVDDYAGTATWTAVGEVGAYTITFDANGGAFGDGTTTKQVATNSAGELNIGTVEQPTLSGYDFAGWRNDAGEQISGTFTFTEDTTLTAAWNRHSSGSSGGGSVTRYTITIEDADHGSVKSSVSRASRGSSITLTVTPNEGYELESITVTQSGGGTVSLNDRGDGKYTFTMPRANVTVEAVFAASGEQPSGLPFTDVDADDWFYDAVAYVYENGMMEGTSDTTFVPDMALSRAMVAQVLYNLEEQPEAAASAGFPDVAADAWYADAVNWAAESGVVTGYDTGAFGPEDAVTREQLAVMLYRYAQYKGYDVTASADLSAYSDAASVSAYAETAMSWAVGEELFQGVGASLLSPSTSASRAEVATILMRFTQTEA